MRGLSEAEIKATRERAIRALKAKGYEIVNTLFTDEWYSSENMKREAWKIYRSAFGKITRKYVALPCCVFCKGWESARGCKIEHEAAVAYGLDIIEEE